MKSCDSDESKPWTLHHHDDDDDDVLFPCRVFIPGELPADLQKRVDRYRQAADGQVFPGECD